MLLCQHLTDSDTENHNEISSYNYLSIGHMYDTNNFSEKMIVTFRQGNEKIKNKI